VTESLKPWQAVAAGNEGIRGRRLPGSVLAANIWAVVQGTVLDVYPNPGAFFRKTYLTTGLSTVLTRRQRVAPLRRDR